MNPVRNLQKKKLAAHNGRIAQSRFAGQTIRLVRRQKLTKVSKNLIIKTGLQRQISNGVKQATLCLLIKENRNGKELLLAMKKRGFGIGKWNGVGGKFDPKKDKDINKAAIREVEEEIGVKVKKLKKVAILSFYFSEHPSFNQDVHVFLVNDWKGEPKESEEMSPKWFKENEIPFKEMWPDDKFWLPKVLKEKKVRGTFVFKNGEVITEQNIEIVEEI